MAYTKYSLTPSSNTAAPPDGAPEGMLPSAVNDTMRDMMAQIRDCGDGIRGGTYTMTAPIITGGTITGSTINNSAIGGTTAAAGNFTTIGATGVATFSAGAVGTPAITTTGDTNTGIFFPAADTIAFTEGGVESMRIDSSGQVGIGTTSPTDNLYISRATNAAGGISVVNTNNAQASQIAQLYLQGGDNAYAQIKLQANSVNSSIRGNSDGSLAFLSSTTERMRIDSSGDVGIGTTSPGGYKLAVGDGSGNRGRIMLKGATGGSYPEINIDDTMNTSGKNYQIYSTGGHLKVANQTDAAVSFVANAFGIGLADNAPVDGNGIRFPATQSASSNANTLDDYEEGTWTPVIVPSGGSLTSYTSSGTYTKIGRTVYVVAKFAVVTTGTASGYANASGYPFTSANGFETMGVAREGASSGDVYATVLTGNSTAGFILGLTGNGALNWTAGRTYYWNFSYNV